jgi:hypothetical protein
MGADFQLAKTADFEMAIDMPESVGHLRAARSSGGSQGPSEGLEGQDRVSWATRTNRSTRSASARGEVEGDVLTCLRLDIRRA